MTKANLQDQPYSLADAVASVIQEALAANVNPADLTCALAIASVRLGLEFAPNAGVALALVMKAASDVAVDWVSAQQPRNSNQPKTAPADPIDLQSVPPGASIH